LSPNRQGLTGGLIAAVLVILLLLTAYFQSVRLALVVISTTPAVIAGVVLALVVTRTTLEPMLYGGIHYLFSIQDGWAIGQRVANGLSSRGRRAGKTMKCSTT
jgi:multidrug efflux pump subunit AcrB